VLLAVCTYPDMRYLIALALCVSVALADASDLLRMSDENLTDASDTFRWRWCHSEKKTTPTVTGGFFHLPEKLFIWRSSSVDYDSAKDSKKKDADALVGAGFLSSLAFAPTAIVAYGVGKNAVDLKDKEFIEKLCQGEMYEPFRGGAVAFTVYSLEEVYPNGTTVDDTLTVLRSATCEPEEIKRNYAKGMTCTMVFPRAQVTMTYVASKIAGILSYGVTPVSPLSLGLIIEVNHFVLTNPENHVRLNMGLITSSGAAGIEGKAKIIKKEGEQVYAAISEFAVINGARTAVPTSIRSGPNPLGTNENGLLSVALGSNLDYHVATVDFPAGIKSFVYDPAAGANSVVYEAGASTVALSLFVAIVCALLFLF